MKRVFLLVAILLVGVIAGVIGGVIAGLVLPAEWRAKLSRSLALPIGHCLEHMPDGGPGKKILSGVLQALKQNIQIVALLQEQLPVEEAPEVESPSSRAEEHISGRSGEGPSMTEKSGEFYSLGDKVMNNSNWKPIMVFGMIIGLDVFPWSGLLGLDVLKFLTARLLE